MNKDYYAILGVAKGASDRAIKRAYRHWARRCHPDLHQGSKEKEEQFKEIAEAYEVLGNHQRRALYDKTGKAKEEGPSPSHGSSGRGMVDTEAMIANFMDLVRRSWGGKRPS